MGITFRHDAAAGLIGSYAAGQAVAGRRRQKYAMAALLQDRRHRQRLEELGGRRGVRGGAAGAPAGVWNDPLSMEGLAGKSRHGRAARRARARKIRLGKYDSIADIPAEWRPTFAPQDAIDRQQDLDDATLADERRVTAADVADQRRVTAADVADQRRVTAAEQTRTSGVRKEYRTTTSSRLEDPAYSEDQRTAGNKLLKELGLLEGSKRLGAHDEAGAQMEMQDLQGKLDKILNEPKGIPDLTLGEQLQKRFVTDPETGQRFQWMGEEKGLVLVPPPDDPKAAARSLKNKFNIARKAHNTALQAQEKALNDELHPPSPEQRNHLQDRVNQAKEEMEDAASEMESLDDQFEEETIEKKGTTLQRLGDDKGFVPIDMSKGTEGADKEAKANEDATVNKFNEILDAQDIEGFEGKKKSKEEALEEAKKYIERQEWVRQQVRGIKPSENEQQVFDDIVGTPPVVQPHPSDLTVPATGQLAGLTMGQGKPGIPAEPGPSDLTPPVPGEEPAPAAQPAPDAQKSPRSRPKTPAERKQSIQNDIPTDFRISHSREADVLRRLAGIPQEELSQNQIDAVAEALAVLREYQLEQSKKREPVTVDPSETTMFDTMIR